MKHSSLSYLFTNAAQADIEQLYLDGAEQFGRPQADKYARGLSAVFDRIAQYPRLARLREEIDPPVRALPYKSHIIIYDIGSDDRVIIVRVRHCREDWMAEQYDASGT